MTWFKVDDKLHSHKKAIKAGEAMSLWVMAGSWCADQLTDGFVPDYVVCRMFPLQGEDWASRLVAVGLWDEDHHEGDDGWRFHEWEDHQPTRSEVESKREAERERKRRQRRTPGGQFEESKPKTSNVPPGHRMDNQQDSTRDSAPSHTVPSRPVPSLKESASSDDAFNRFWAIYPRKVAKKAARTKWDTAIKTTDPEQIIEGAKKYAKKCELERTEKNFIKQPDGWLNAGRWEDEIELTTIKRAPHNPWSKEAHVY